MFRFVAQCLCEMNCEPGDLFWKLGFPKIENDQFVKG